MNWLLWLNASVGNFANWAILTLWSSISSSSCERIIIIIIVTIFASIIVISIIDNYIISSSWSSSTYQSVPRRGIKFSPPQLSTVWLLGNITSLVVIILTTILIIIIVILITTTILKSLRKYARIAISRKRHFRSPKRKHFAIQSTPQNLGKLSSLLATRKWFFRPLLRTKRAFSRKALMARFKIFLVVQNIVF